MRGLTWRLSWLVVDDVAVVVDVVVVFDLLMYSLLYIFVQK